MKFKIVVLILLFFCMPVFAYPLLEPSQYAVEGQCELIAKAYQEKYGGDLILIQPLKEDGTYDTGHFNGHIINKAWSKERGTYYTDYRTGHFFNNTEEVSEWYEINFQSRVSVFNLNKVHPPFPLIWHY